MRNLILRQRLAYMSVMILLAVLATAVSASSPTSVGLISFEATPLTGRVRLNWETATEVDTAGFWIERRTGSSGEFERLQEIGFIEGQGQPAFGAQYEVYDDTITNGQTYTYMLVEVETDSSENELEDTVTVTTGATSTPTAIVIDPGNGDNPPTATSNGQPPPTNTPRPTNTATATPTNTPRVTNTATAAPTNTPRPINTTAPTATAQTQTVATTAPAATRRPTATATEPILLSPTPSTETPAQTESARPRTNQDNSAAALAQSTPVSGYPAGTPTTAATTVTASAEVTPYPPGRSTNDNQSPSIPSIGSNSRQDELTATAVSLSTNSSDNTTALRGRLLLWAGFLVAFVIFVASVIGSIYLFTRNREL